MKSPKALSSIAASLAALISPAPFVAALLASLPALSASEAISSMVVGFAPVNPEPPAAAPADDAAMALVTAVGSSVFTPRMVPVILGKFLSPH